MLFPASRSQTHWMRCSRPNNSSGSGTPPGRLRIVILKNSLLPRIVECRTTATDLLLSRANDNNKSVACQGGIQPGIDCAEGCTCRAAFAVRLCGFLGLCP